MPEWDRVRVRRDRMGSDAGSEVKDEGFGGTSESSRSERDERDEVGEGGASTLSFLAFEVDAVERECFGGG